MAEHIREDEDTRLDYLYCDYFYSIVVPSKFLLAVVESAIPALDSDCQPKQKGFTGKQGSAILSV